MADRRRMMCGSVPSGYEYAVQNSSVSSNSTSFSYDGETFHIKNGSGSIRNIYTYADGHAITSSALSSATKWIELKTGDVMTVEFYDIQAASSGDDVIQLYSTTGNYYRNMGTMSISPSIKRAVITKAMGADGIIPGLQHYIGQRLEYSYKMHIYINGRRLV